jgi:hypothetical protein
LVSDERKPITSGVMPKKTKPSNQGKMNKKKKRVRRCDRLSVKCLDVLTKDFGDPVLAFSAIVPPNPAKYQNPICQ